MGKDYLLSNCRECSACRICNRVGRRYAHILRPWFTCGVVVALMLAASISYILVREMGNAAAWLYGVCLAYNMFALLQNEKESLA